MLGLVNVPCECIDFYAQPKTTHRSFVFPGQRRNKSTISYTNDGRRLIDGKVEKMKGADEMWRNLLINLLIKRMTNPSYGGIDYLHEENHTNDSVETSSLDDAMMRSILPQDRESEILTERTNLNSKNSVPVNKEGNVAEAQRKKTKKLMKRRVN